MTRLLVQLRRHAWYRAFTRLYATAPLFRLALVALIPVLWMLVANVAPLAQMVRISFFAQYPVPAGDSPVWTLDQYRSFFARPLYLNAFLRSFVFAVLVTAVTLVLVFPVAWYISKAAPKGRRTRLLLLVIAPFWVSEIIRSFAWIVMLANRGAVNSLLAWLDIPGVPFNLLLWMPLGLQGISDRLNL